MLLVALSYHFKLLNITIIIIVILSLSLPFVLLMVSQSFELQIHLDNVVG